MTAVLSPADRLLWEARRWKAHKDFDQDRWDGWIGSLDPRIARFIERELSAKSIDGWRAHPAAMMYYLTGDPWWLRPHVEFLSQKFRRLMSPEGPDRMIWNLPGRAGKTRSVQGGLTWSLDRNPDARSIVHSYVIDLASDTSIEVREMIRTYDEIGAAVAPGRAEQNRWYTTDRGGLLASSWGSRVVGYGVNEHGLLVIDDPMKNWQEAHNENARRRVNSEFTGTLRHRLDTERAKILIVMHRMHRYDLSGHIVETAEQGAGEAFEQVVLPALAGDGDPLGREPGEVLDREAFDLNELKSRHIALGSYVASAIEQQDPQEEEGNELKRAWFKLDEAMPDHWDQALMSWDLKLKDTDEGDFVVGQVWVRTGHEFWMLDQLRGKWDHATTANAMCLLAVRHPSIRLTVVEAAAAANDVIKSLAGTDGYVITDEMASGLGMTDDERVMVQRVRRNGLSGIVKHAVKGSKSVRARNFIAPAAEAGNVHLNARGPWLPHYLEEMAAFPLGDHDDQVDATSQALNRLDSSQGSVSAPTRQRRVPQQRKVATGRVAGRQVARRR